MKLAKKYLKYHRIFNPYGIAQRANNKLFIAYSPQTLGRMCENAHWQIIGIDFKSDPNSAWYNHGNKTFNVFSREEKQPQLEMAFNWCAEQYGLKAWEKDVWGDYHPSGTLARLKVILEASKDMSCQVENA